MTPSEQQWGQPYPPGNNPAAYGQPAAPQRPQRGRREPWLWIIIAVLAAAVITLLIVVLTDDGSSSQLGGPPADVTAPASGHPPSTQDTRTTSPGATSSASAPGPTGQEYRPDEQPAVGDCVDTSRNSRGNIVLNRANCADPPTPLVLDSIQEQRCPENGYSSIRGSTGVMCFTWNVRSGDCVDLFGPRKAPCSATSSPSGRGGTITITQVKPGSRDGTGCPDPNRFLQAGAGPDRGIACFMPTSMVSNNTTVPPPTS